MGRCSICGGTIYNQDYPGSKAMCDNCTADYLYQQHCDLEMEMSYNQQEEMRQL